MLNKEERLKTQARLLDKILCREVTCGMANSDGLISIVDGDVVVIWNSDGVGKERRQQRYLVDQDIIRFQ